MRKKPLRVARTVIDKIVACPAADKVLYETFDNFERNYRPRTLTKVTDQPKELREANWTAAGHVVSAVDKQGLQIASTHKPIWPMDLFANDERMEKVRCYTVLSSYFLCEPSVWLNLCNSTTTRAAR